MTAMDMAVFSRSAKIPGNQSSAEDVYLLMSSFLSSG